MKRIRNTVVFSSVAGSGHVAVVVYNLNNFLFGVGNYLKFIYKSKIATLRYSINALGRPQISTGIRRKWNLGCRGLAFSSV